MGVGREEYIMVGVCMKDAPFDIFDDKYERYVCGFKDETLRIVNTGPMSSGDVCIGRVIGKGDEYSGVEKTEISIRDIRVAMDCLPMEISSKLKIDVKPEDIKCYFFTRWS